MKAEPATPAEYSAFKALLDRLMSIPHSVVVDREAEYQERSKLNPNRRGPKKRAIKGKRKD